MPRGIFRFGAAEILSTLLLDTRTRAFLTADTNDYDLSVGTKQEIGGSGGDWAVTGITGGAEGRAIELTNVSAKTINLVNESASSLAANRILTGLVNGATFSLLPNQSIWLTYSNYLGRWSIAHGAQTFDSETDAPLTALFRGARQSSRFRPFMDSARETFLRALGAGQGFMKLAIAAKVSGDSANQAFGALSGCQVSFTTASAGEALVIVHGVIKTDLPGLRILPSAKIGARFDADTPQELDRLDEDNGGGSDYVNADGLTGIWHKSLTAGAHTADLCFGEGSGQFGLYSSATIPAVIAVLYPG